MKKFLETKYGKLILAAIVIGVWGVNIFNFSEMASDETESSRSVFMNMTEGEFHVPSFEQYQYKATERNPFSPSPDLRQSTGVINETEGEEEYQQPVLYLTGVMDEMAILRNQQEETFFVEVNDTFNDIRVQSIYKDSVVLIHNNKPFTVNLN